MGADLMSASSIEGKPAGAPLGKFLPHQVFPGSDDRPQKFRLPLPLGLGDEEVAVAGRHQEPFAREGGGDPAGLVRGRLGASRGRPFQI